jgi:hypothetical protein
MAGTFPTCPFIKVGAPEVQIKNYEGDLILIFAKEGVGQG